MKDLLDNYVIVSYNCVGFWVYRLFYPKKDPNFIRYNTPLIAHLTAGNADTSNPNVNAPYHVFEDDNFDFIALCENYDSYMLNTKIVCEGNGIKLPGLKGSIVFVADTDPDMILRKWEGRAELGRNKTKIFIWDASWWGGNEELKQRFLKLDGYSIYLTDREEEEFDDGKHFVVMNPMWEGKKASIDDMPYKFKHSANGITPTGNNTMRATAPLFKKIIEKRIMKKSY